MKNYTIHDFWKRRLNVQQGSVVRDILGWSFERSGLTTFKEAPLTLSADFGPDANPENSPILLVSAPGAVGKSTLARQVAFETNSLYLDLAKAEPVGGNTLSGGLAKVGLYGAWEEGTTAILIDGLDEARLRVTREAFEAFLGDVAELSKGRTVPTVLFGRTGAAQDAWLILDGLGIEIAVLEIGYYDSNTSVEFAEACLRAAHPESSHAAVEKRAVELLLERLRNQTGHDGDRFAGYAPVLQAVADRVAQDRNPSALVAEIEKGAQPVTLKNVALAILERERAKLDQLQFEDATLAGKLYLPDEQLDRLVARLFRLPAPDGPTMGARDAVTYSKALDTWVSEHPFLDGGYGTSSSVFDAMITTRALKNPSSADAAIKQELHKGAAANPFLSEFYIFESGPTAIANLPPEHIGIVYASLRSRLSLGDTASLNVDGAEDAEEEEALRAEIEITLARRDVDRPTVLHFGTEQAGILKLGAHVQDVDISVPHSIVEVGPGPESVLVAPVSIQCQQLRITTEKIIIESLSDQSDAAVFLEAEGFEGAQMVSIPVIRGTVSLAASWPGVRNHPWTSFATAPSQTEDPRVDEALRRFRKFVIAFRSHSKGNLARFKDKLEHARMTKGAGQKILNLMVSEGILILHGSMYYLDPDRLGEKTGATYADCMARCFPSKAIAFAKQALEEAK